jgi:hypothetical protein
MLMAKRKVARAKAIKVVRAARTRAVKEAKPIPTENMSDLKLALVVLIFGAATAFSAVYKLGNITILFGLVAAAAALAMTVKKR